MSNPLRARRRADHSGDAASGFHDSSPFALRRASDPTITAPKRRAVHKAAVGGTTVLLAGGTLALAAPEVAEAKAARHHQTAATMQQRVHVPRAAAARAASQSRGSRGELHARMLAALQRAVRKQRAQMTARWDSKAQRAVRHALKQSGRPYVWGGTGRGGYDCSGLVQQAWKQAGVTLPRVSHDQFRRTRTKVARDKLRAGDLVFFNRLGHVGMYLGDKRFVHSPRPGRHVTVERMKGWYLKSYAGAVRPGWKTLPAIPTDLW